MRRGWTHLFGTAMAAAVLLAACAERAGVTKPEAGWRIYVSDERSDEVTVVDGATNRVLASIPVGRRPRGLRVSPDGRSLYVALSGSPIAGPGVDESKLPPPDRALDGVAVIDLASNSLRHVIRGVDDPEQLAVSADGRIYVAAEDSGQAVVIDIASGRVLARIPVGDAPEGVTLTPDQRQAWVTAEDANQVVVIDTATLKPVRTIPVGLRPRTVAFSPDGRRAYVPGEGDRSITMIDTRLFQATRIRLPDESARPMGAVVSPDGARLYVSTGRGGRVMALDARSLAVLGSAEVGGRPWGVALSPDGRWLYSAGGPADDVAVVDAAQMSVAAKVAVGKGPWGVAVAPLPRP